MELKTLLDTIRVQELLPDKVIIVDSSDFSLDLDEEINYEFIYIKSKPGLTYQRNIGLNRIFESHVASGLVHFLDDDVILQPEYFKKSKETFIQDPTIVGCTGNDLNRSDKSSLSFRLLRYISENVFNFSGKLTKSCLNLGIFNSVSSYRIDWMPGCNMIYQINALSDARFDEERLGYSFGEDVDFTYRISKNAKLVYSPFIKYRHELSSNNRIKPKDLHGISLAHKMKMYHLYPNDFSYAHIIWVHRILGLRHYFNCYQDFIHKLKSA
jgi:hypothetical protein